MPHQEPIARRAVPLLLAIICAATPAVAQQVLKQQPLSPLDVKEYTVEATTTDDGKAAYQHKVVIQDEMQQSITAVQLLFAGHDAFSVLSLDRGSMSQKVDPEKQGAGTWTFPAGAASQFAVLVEKVRYWNGDIWEADHEILAAALRTIDPEFQTGRLEENPQPAPAITVNVIEVKVENDSPDG